MIIEGIEVEVIRKNNKTLRLTVCPPCGKVKVVAPLRLTDEAVRSFVIKNLEWIEKQRQKYPTSLPQYVSGETHIILGKEYTLFVLCGTHKDEVVEIDDNLFIRTKNSSPEHCQKLLLEYKKQRLEQVLKNLMEQWQTVIGVCVYGWAIRNMISRWGSCNVKTHHIVFSMRLCEEPIECVEYIVVHELCHLIVPNHSKDFKALLSKYLADWKLRCKRLNHQI